tara:strand:- start:160 stop:465 length:306 start_codon:yes stop_codon:yes gene_type:complete
VLQLLALAIVGSHNISRRFDPLQIGSRFAQSASKSLTELLVQLLNFTPKPLMVLGLCQAEWTSMPFFALQINGMEPRRYSPHATQERLCIQQLLFQHAVTN